MYCIPESQARAVIEPHLSRIRKAVQGALSTYYSGPYSALRYRHTSRTDANICRDLIIFNIKQEFDNVSGVQYSENKGLFLLTIDGLVVLKFKKFNRRLMSSNIPTRQSTLFLGQEFPGMPPNGLLHVGYVLNALGTDIEGVYVTCRHESVNIWVWDITFAAVSASAPLEVAAAIESESVDKAVFKREVKVKDYGHNKTPDKKANSGDK